MSDDLVHDPDEMIHEESGLTVAEASAILHEAAGDGDLYGELAKALIDFSEAIGMPLPEPETPWERDRLIESGREKVARAEGGPEMDW